MNNNDSLNTDRSTSSTVSRSINSNQSGPHQNLESLVKKHCSSRSQRPIAEHNLRAFDSMMEITQGKALIFDSGCGTGLSTIKLAERHPNSFIVGIDKSAKRLSLNPAEKTTTLDNYRLVRADLVDFLRIAQQHNITLQKHYFLYPNPWPKSTHVQRRWQGSPLFREILELGGDIELRTNWKTYADEFSLALHVAGLASTVQGFTIEQNDALTPFEKKYSASKHRLWRLVCDRSSTAHSSFANSALYGEAT